jgi:hypothetical protein
MPLETFRWFAMLRYEFVVLLMMTSFLLVKGLRIAMMYQGVNVEGLEAYIGVGCLSDATGSIISQRADIVADAMGFEPAIDVETACTSARFPHIKLSRFGSNQFTDDASLSGLFATCC